MISKLILTAVLLFCPTAFAADPGEITEISSLGIVKFVNDPDAPVAVGEELRVVSPDIYSKILLEVKSVSGDVVEAEISRVQVKPYGYVRKLKAGDRVQLFSRRDQLKSFSFQLGNTSSEKVGEYGGSNLFLGLGFMGFFRDELFWSIRLLVEHQGKDAGIERRRSQYLIGMGWSRGDWELAGHIGSLDTMTINEQNVQQRFDPITGTMVVNGVNHNSSFGYQLSTTYNYFIRRPSRNDHTGWSVSPTLAYTDSFGTSASKASTNFGVGVVWWWD